MGPQRACPRLGGAGGLRYRTCCTLLLRACVPRPRVELRSSPRVRLLVAPPTQRQKVRGIVVPGILIQVVDMQILGRATALAEGTAVPAGLVVRHGQGAPQPAARDRGDVNPRTSPAAPLVGGPVLTVPPTPRWSSWPPPLGRRPSRSGRCPASLCTQGYASRHGPAAACCRTS